MDFNKIIENKKQERLKKILKLAKDNGIKLLQDTSKISEEELKLNQQKIFALKAVAENLEIEEDSFVNEIIRIKSMNPFFLK